MTSASPCTGHVPAEGEKTNGEGGNGVCRCGDASVEDVSDAGVAKKKKEEARCKRDTWTSGIDNTAPYWPRGIHAD